MHSAAIRGGGRKKLLAPLALLLAAFVLLDRTAFDGLRRSIAYMQAEKGESGCARLFQYSSDGSSRYADLNGSLLVASWMTRETLSTTRPCSFLRWPSALRTGRRRCMRSEAGPFIC